MIAFDIISELPRERLLDLLNILLSLWLLPALAFLICRPWSLDRPCIPYRVFLDTWCARLIRVNGREGPQLVWYLRIVELVVRRCITA